MRKSERHRDEAHSKRTGAQKSAPGRDVPNGSSPASGAPRSAEPHNDPAGLDEMAVVCAPASEPVNLKSLLAVRRVYEGRLEDDPSDGSVRIGLAWVLLCEALCRFRLHAGAEAASSRPPADDPDSTESLLRMSVHHAEAARRLALDASTIAEVERLEAAVAMIGRDDLLRAEDGAMSARIRDLTRSVLPRTGSDEG